MTRHVTARITVDVHEPAELVFSVAAASGHRFDQESFTATVAGEGVPVTETPDRTGGRLHVLSPAPVGRLEVSYAAAVGTWQEPTDQSWPAESFEYIRPSRYAESDRLAAVAEANFGQLRGRELLDAVSSWVGVRLAYVSGSSRHTDGAVDTYLSRQGVCRDYAHLAIALLRARNVPARLVSVYAPGLSPMDFHAVAEARLDGVWQVVDPTALAPRTSMVRIATGRDASDTAFLTVQSGRADLVWVEVSAYVDGTLPNDDPTKLAQLI